MRLFIAIDVPESIKEHLTFLQRSIIDTDNNLKLIHPKNIHLTLNFIGEEKKPEKVIKKLQKINFTPFNLQLSELGFFPTKENPHILWVGLKKNKYLFDLQKKIDLFFTPKKSFKPHLTIARIKKIKEEEKIINLLQQIEKLQVKNLSFKVKSFRLYKSTLTPIGPVYEVLETFTKQNTIL